MSMRRALILGVALAALAACGGEPSSRPDDPPALPEKIVKVTASKQIVLPSYAYQVTNEQYNVVARAAQLEIRRCMKRFGFDYAIPAEDAVDTTSHENGLYGLIDAPQAARYGYHPATTAAEQRRLKNRRPEPSAEFQMVLAGRSLASFGGQAIPEGGCVGEGQRKTQLDKLSSQELAQLWGSTTTRAMNDARVRAAMSAWSACMKKSGYDYPDSWRANNDTRWGGATVTQIEIATATTDVRCKQETNLVGIWMAVETGFQERIIDERAEQFAELKNRNREIVTKANNIVSAG